MKERSSPKNRRDEAGKYAKSAASIERILASARQLFTRKSYAEVTISDLASAAGMTKGGLYHHFSSKEDLYLEMMFDYLEEQKELMQSAAKKGRNCRECLHLLTVQFMNQSPLAHQLMRLVRRDVNIFQGEPRRRLIRAYQASLPELEEEILAEGMKEGEIPQADPRLLSWVHVAMIETVLTDYARDLMGGPEARTDFVLKIFFDGLDAMKD